MSNQESLQSRKWSLLALIAIFGINAVLNGDLSAPNNVSSLIISLGVSLPAYIYFWYAKSRLLSKVITYLTMGVLVGMIIFFVLYNLGNLIEIHTVLQVFLALIFSYLSPKSLYFKIDEAVK